MKQDCTVTPILDIKRWKYREIGFVNSIRHHHCRLGHSVMLISPNQHFPQMVIRTGLADAMSELAGEPRDGGTDGSQGPKRLELVPSGDESPCRS